jgi:hypothetical protein
MAVADVCAQAAGRGGVVSCRARSQPVGACVTCESTRNELLSLRVDRLRA